MLRYKLLGHSGLRVAEICLGAMTFGQDFGWGADYDECRRMVDHYADLGGNFIDTANGYTGGTSERFVGRLVKGQRGRFVIATKFTNSTARTGPQVGRNPNASGNHRKSMFESLHASLERLDTDYVDLYWVHAWDQVTPADEVMRALDDMVRAGKVLYVGMSNAPAWWIARSNTMAELRGWSRFVAMQIEYSLVERTAERELIPMARALDIGVTAWSPLAGGVLTGKYGQAASGGEARRLDVMKRTLPERRVAIARALGEVATEIGCSPAQVALAWLLARHNTIPIVGARTMDQYLDNMGAATRVLEPAVIERLDELSSPGFGYPQTALAGPLVRELAHSGLLDRLHIHRDEGALFSI